VRNPQVLSIAAALLATAAIAFAGEDGRTIVLRSIEADQRNSKIAENYTFIQRQEEREVDAQGRTRRRKVSTYDITLTEGSPYRRLIARDDKPLPPDEEAKERKKLETSIAERRAETPAQREKRVAEWHKRREREREFLRELPEAFDFRLLGEETVEGRHAYDIQATPRPGYRPKTRAGRLLPSMKGRLWIDAQDYQWIKLDAEVIDTLSFGGIVARLYPGSRISLVQTRVNDEIWLPRVVRIAAAGRLFLVKRFGADIEFTFRDYRKFQSDSRIVSVEETK
jgi:hypothetical protein